MAKQVFGSKCFSKDLLKTTNLFLILKLGRVSPILVWLPWPCQLHINLILPRSYRSLGAAERGIVIPDLLKVWESVTVLICAQAVNALGKGVPMCPAHCSGVDSLTGNPWQTISWETSPGVAPCRDSQTTTQLSPQPWRLKNPSVTVHQAGCIFRGGFS